MRINDIAVKSLLRRKVKAAFILTGLMIGVATVVAVITFTRAMTEDINHKLEKFGANILIVPHTETLALSYGGMAMGGVSFEMQPILQSDLEKVGTIKDAASIAAIGPVVLGKVRVEQADVLLAGIDFSAVPILKPWWKIQGGPPQENQILAGAEAARVLGLQHDQYVMVAGRRMLISGVLETTGSQDDQLLITTLSTAQAVLNKPGEVSLVEVAALCHACPIEEMIRQISEKLPTASVMAIQQVVKSRMEALAHFQRFSVALSLVVVLIGGMVVLITFLGSVKERTKEIGIFRAIGFRRRHVMQIIFVEAAFLSSLAGVGGYLTGIGAISVGLYLSHAHVSTAVLFNPPLAAGAIALALGVGLAASAYPAAVAARLDPNQALAAL
jgi:putative ABC transport system permease protein